MSRASVLRLGALASLWGSNFLLIKVSLDGFSPIQIVLIRMATGALVLLTFAALRGEVLPREPQIWAHVAVAAVIANVIPYFLFGWGEQRVDSAVAGSLNATTPLFTVALAVATGTEAALTNRRAGGLLLGFLGAVVIIAPWRDFSGTAAGALACVAAAGSYAISYVYMRRYLTGRGTTPIALATSQLTAGALMLTLAAPLVARQAVDLQPDIVFSVLALGALGTGVAYMLNYRLIQDEGATSASTVTYLLPIVAVILGAAMLGEAITWNLFVGTTIVLVGVALSEGRRTPTQPPTQPAHTTTAGTLP